MWWVGRFIGLGILMLLSYFDLRTRKVPVLLLAGSNAAAFAVLCYQAVCQGEDLWTAAGGIAVGALFLLVSRVTGEGMGYADSWGILILGIYLGIWELLKLLLAAFALLAFSAAALLIFKKMSRRCTLPFFPFLTGGYIAVLFGAGGVL